MLLNVNYTPIVQLDKQYWQDNCFCPSCGKFVYTHLEEGEVEVCPNCGEVEMISVETAIEVGILEAEI